jgi:hypothetical protein
MRAYESGAASYFATPPTNLIYAFNASLKEITRSSHIGVEDRLRLHREASDRIKGAAAALHLKQVSAPQNSANGMTAVSSCYISILCSKGFVPDVLTFDASVVFPRRIDSFGCIVSAG